MKKLSLVCLLLVLTSLISCKKETIEQYPDQYFSVYTAVVDQNGVDHPVVSVLGGNTIGLIVWERIGVGTYKGTLKDAFVSGKTWLSIDGGFSGTDEFDIVHVDDDQIHITSYIGGSGHDGVLDETSIEIRVYD